MLGIGGQVRDQDRMRWRYSVNTFLNLIDRKQYLPKGNVDSWTENRILVNPSQRTSQYERLPSSMSFVDYRKHFFSKGVSDGECPQLCECSRALHNDQHHVSQSSKIGFHLHRPLTKLGGDMVPNSLCIKQA